MTEKVKKLEQENMHKKDKNDQLTAKAKNQRQEISSIEKKLVEVQSKLVTMPELMR